MIQVCTIFNIIFSYSFLFTLLFHLDIFHIYKNNRYFEFESPSLESRNVWVRKLENIKTNLSAGPLILDSTVVFEDFVDSHEVVEVCID